MPNEGPATLIAQQHPPEIPGQIPLTWHPLIRETLQPNLLDFATVHQALIVPVLFGAKRTVSGDNSVAMDLENSAASSWKVRH
jgi:hypothetical protein